MYIAYFQGDDQLVQLNKHLRDTEERLMQSTMDRGHRDHEEAIHKIREAKDAMKQLLMVYSLIIAQYSMVVCGQS